MLLGSRIITSLGCLSRGRAERRRNFPFVALRGAARFGEAGRDGGGGACGGGAMRGRGPEGVEPYCPSQWGAAARGDQAAEGRRSRAVG